MGSFANSVSHDFLVVDDLEPVVFVSKAAPGGSDTTINLTGADFGLYTAREIAASDGQFTAKMRRCNLPHVQIAAANAPKDGDRIQRTGDGTNWRIVEPISLDDFGISFTVNLSQEK